MNYINSYFFSDPYIRPNGPLDSLPSSIPPSPPTPPEFELEITSSEKFETGLPEIKKDLHDLPNPNVIVYRSAPTSVCHGPAITIPILNLDISAQPRSGDFSIQCISTYPQEAPFFPIADRFDIRFFHDSFILALTDGCGLHPSSRLAPKAAIEGFWNFLESKLKEDLGHFTIHKMGAYLQGALKAAHFNIYWDAYERSQEGFTVLQQNVHQILTQMDDSPIDTGCITEILHLRKNHLLEEIDQIKKALEGDLETQRSLVKKKLNTRFYEDYAGATTFMCSALLKNANSSDYPFYLLTLNLGDGQCFVLREGTLLEMTKDTRKDLSNVRDPGGKMGLCSPIPLKMDERNLQFSLTPCRSKDLLFFMTDGVLDNLNPTRIGLHPSGIQTPYWVQEKIREAGSLTGEELQELLNVLNLDYTSWKDVPLEVANQIKSKFTKTILQILVSKGKTAEEANQKIIWFCNAITEGHREKNTSNSSHYPSQEPLGKPDHTTSLCYQIP